MIPVSFTPRGPSQFNKGVSITGRTESEKKANGAKFCVNLKHLVFGSNYRATNHGAMMFT